MAVAVLLLCHSASAQNPATPLNGVYAACRSYSATPLSHFQNNRATRTGSGSSTKYFARGSGTQLTASTVILSETGKTYYEVRNSCPTPPNCTKPGLQPPSGLGLRCRFNVPNQGMRDYDVHVPNNYTNLTTFPLLMEMHGGGGGAPPPATEYSSGWREVSDLSSAPFIVVWPVGSNEGSGPFGEEWQTCNYDNSTAQAPCPAPGYPNDRAFLIEVVKKVVADLKIDKKRIYAAGLSSGAAMVHTLSCKYSQYFAAVAPMATGINVQMQSRARDRFNLTVNCAASREIPQFYVHSPHDPISMFSEGQSTVSFWRTKFGCASQTTTSFVHDFDIFDVTDALYPPSWDTTICRSTKCGPAANPGQSEVAFCEVDGSSDILNEGGHIVWNGDDMYFPVAQPNEPRLAQWAWDWMRRFALPADPTWPPPL